jgi:hypothetical protein
MEQKPEPRVEVDLIVRAWGMGANGRPFSQNAHAVDISSEGAKLSDLEHPLTPGDVIGVQLGDKKARVRVVWVIDAGALQKVQAGVRVLEGQQCPWEQELSKPEKVVAREAQASSETKNKRRFARHKTRFPIELRDPRGVGTHMQTSAIDISGRGCYVETLMPLPLGTALNIAFWMDAERVETTGVVKASDGGVGMGIEFTGLDPQGQERLQHLLDELDPESADSADAEDNSPAS